MEFSFTAEAMTKPYVLLLMLAVVVVVGCLYYRYVYAPYQVIKQIGVKGPTPQVFWGNITEYRKVGEETMFQNLYREYGPISGFYIGDQAYLLVADLKMLKEIMVDATENFSSSVEQGIGDRIHDLPPSLLSSAYSDKEWQRIRSIFASAFIPTKLIMMSPLLEENNEAMLEIFREATLSKETLDVWSLYCSLALEVLCTQLGESVRVLTGDKSDLSKAVQSFFRHSTAAQRSSDSSTVAGRRWKSLGRKVRVQADFKAVKKAVSELVHSRRQFYQQQEQEKQELRRQRSASFSKPHPSVPAKPKPALKLQQRVQSEKSMNSKGFLQLLVEGSKNRDTTEEEMISCCVTFLLSGYETIASVLAHTSYLLALNLEVQDRLCTSIDSFFKINSEASLFQAVEEGDLDYLDMVVHESLRLYPPTPKIIRLCVNTCTVKGITIPEGTKVVIPINLLHHARELWPQKTHSFLPKRFNQHPSKFCHMPFGEGPHSCVGMTFAMMEVKLALLAILRKYKFVKAPETEVPLKSKDGTSTRQPSHGIYLKVRKRIITGFSY